MRVLRFKYILLYSLLIILLGTIIGIGIICYLGITHDNHNKTDVAAETNLITLLSIIVTLGVAYSFYSIYNVKNEFAEIQAKSRRIERKVNKASALLKQRSIALDRKIELYRLNSSADTDYRNRKFLRALKNELEILKFILLNKEYLDGKLLHSTNEFQSSIGIKRSFIANNILKCIVTLTNEKIEKFKANEFSDIKESILCAIHEIKYNYGLWSLIPKAEQERYTFLFKVVEQLLDQIIKSELPFDIDANEVIFYKLHYYHEGIYEGEKPDDSNTMEGWISEYKKKQDEDSSVNNNSVTYY